jgi:hypothetical protein
VNGSKCIGAMDRRNLCDISRYLVQVATFFPETYGIGEIHDQLRTSLTVRQLMGCPLRY